MDLFLSTYINKLDKKGRISVPAPFRPALTWEEGHQFVAFRALKHATIECCTMKRMYQLSETIDQLDIFSELQEDFTATLFADAHPLFIDREGRAILPEVLIEHASLTDQACFVGRGATFQIWHPDTFKEHQQAARLRLQTQGLSLKLAISEKGDRNA